MTLYYNVIHSPFGDIGLLWKWKGDVPSVTRILLPREVGGLEDLACEQGFKLRRKSAPTIEQISANIGRYLEGEAVAFSLAYLDMDSCYAFQKRVLPAEADIPRGRVSAYGELAHRIGFPRAARAVGTALARNPFPIIIPCHRTVRSDGSLGGFGGGMNMKRALLEMEGVRFDSKGRVKKEFFF
jgi:methylated-DNA-[protein]-cysteine S-methyltransferase